MNFKKAQIYSNQMLEDNDCAVKSVSIACDVPYRVAHKALKKYGRQARRGSRLPMIYASCEVLGFKMEKVAHIAKTVGQLPRDKNTQNGFYMVHVSGHILAIVNGKVEDWSEGSRRVVRGLYKVTPTVSRKERAERKAKLMQD